MAFKTHLCLYGDYAISGLFFTEILLVVSTEVVVSLVLLRLSHVL